MNLLTHVQKTLSALGITCAIDGDTIVVDREPPLRQLKIRSDSDWDASYEKYKRARSIAFDFERRVLRHNMSCEVQVVRLSTALSFSTDRYSLTDSIGNSVDIGDCSPIFALAFFDSKDYKNFFEARVKRRLLESNINTRRVNSLFWTPSTATYTHKGRKAPTDFTSKSMGLIRASLFKLAVEQDDCLSIWKTRNRRDLSALIDGADYDKTIPRANYEEDVVSFYKVAKASPFPSQSFLAYYHVLEFYFLRVSETKLQDRLAAVLNSPSLKSDRGTLNKIISLVRGQDSRSDETEMLRNVIDRYVPEQDLINFISDAEAKCGEKLYSKRRRVFGEDVQVSPIKDHAIANAAKVLKHIRNAIVHSSDRYKREDCHVPLSDTEDVIGEFVPLVRFFAEKVIYGASA